MDTISKLITSLIELLKQYLASPKLPVVPEDKSNVETQPKVIPVTKEIKTADILKSTPSGGKKLEQKMVDFLMGKLKDNGLFIDAVNKRDARTVMRLAAQVCVGIREVGGNNSGPMVELIQETIGTHGKEAWCMAFVQTCIAFAEYCTGVKSPVFASEHCLTVWGNTPIAQRVAAIPAAGAIVIWRHGTTTNGHTGIVESCDGVNFYAFEGNTESGITGSKVVSDGGGVYHTKRSMKPTGSMKVVGFIKPF